MPMTTQAHRVLEFDAIAKVYPNGTRALDGVSFGIRSGSVHGLVGANGAGKSTLIKIGVGALSADSGQIKWKGRPVRWGRPNDATRAGLAAMHQTVPLVPTLTVIENVMLAASGWRRLPASAYRDFEQLQARMDYYVDPDAYVSDLPVGQRQMVGILQALASGADLVVMDEPTASLARTEREVVFRTIRQLAANGTAFLYVSHFLDEVLDLTDELTVLRDGEVVDYGPTSSFCESRLAQGIAGRVLTGSAPPALEHAHESSEILLNVVNLSSPRGLSGINLSVRRGEIVGLAGLLGSGRSELLHAIFGSDAARSGTVEVAGRPVSPSPRAAMRAGIALVPEERLLQGLIAESEIWSNITLAHLPALSFARVFPSRTKEWSSTVNAIDSLGIKVQSPDSLVSELSGGNAQKVLFAKWLLTQAEIYLFDEPCHGIDVGAKADIVALIRSLAASGKAVIIADSELRQLLALSTRILVLHRGRIVAERKSGETSDHELLLLSSGIQGGA
jgi:ribose transport system ATP-binding protein